MSQFFLKFPNEATAITSLSNCRKVDEDGNNVWFCACHSHALDVIDVIHKNGSPVAGFHINFIGNLPEAAEAYVITPVTPSRVWL